MSPPLGLRRVVNASATLTTLGGSLLAPPVIAAMAEAARHFVDLPELQERVGERIATLTGNEAVYVSSGAAAGITLAVAACMAGTSGTEAFPELDGIDRTEVVLFHSQRNGYDYAVRQTGARVVEAGATSDSLRAALGPRTACVLWFAGAHYAEGAPPIEDVVLVAREAGVPVLVDAAAQVPPISSLWHFTREVGADAAIFSGGKGLRGPQSSGLVLGTRAIVDGCRAHGSPNHAIGRGMKVGKEELAGLLAAVEWSLDRDEPALLKSYEAAVSGWLDGLAGLPGVSVERGYPSEAGQPHGRAIVTLGPASGWARDELVEALWAHEPRIAVGVIGADSLALNPQTLEPGEDVVVLDAVLHHLRSRHAT
jgi:L-seryl-tRNA(Ser) seleniumtransferase